MAARLAGLAHLVRGCPATRIGHTGPVWLSCFELKAGFYLTLVSDSTQVDLVHIRPPVARTSLAVFHVTSEPTLTLEFRTSGSLVGVYEMSLSNPRDKKRILDFFARAGVGVVGVDIGRSELAPKRVKSVRLRAKELRNTGKETEEQPHTGEQEQEEKGGERPAPDTPLPPAKRRPEPAGREPGEGPSPTQGDKERREALREAIREVMEEDGFTELVASVRAILAEGPV